MFYAGYDDPLDTVPRCAYSDEEVFYMDVDVWEDYEDVFGIAWKINPVG